MSRYKKSGYTLLEMLVVLVIIGIMASMLSAGISKSVNRSRNNTAEIEIKAMAQQFNSYAIDYGYIKIDSHLAEEAYEEKVKEKVQILNDDYLSTFIKLCDDVVDTEGGGTKTFSRYIYLNSEDESLGIVGFKCETTYKQDPWGSKYLIYVNAASTGDEGTPAGEVIIASNGPDKKSNADTYADNNFGDDIIVAVVPRNIG